MENPRPALPLAFGFSLGRRLEGPYTFIIEEGVGEFEFGIGEVFIVMCGEVVETMGG